MDDDHTIGPLHDAHVRTWIARAMDAWVKDFLGPRELDAKFDAVRAVIPFRPRARKGDPLLEKPR